MNKVIDLNERRKQKRQEDLFKPVQGWIVWLKCSKCETLEYSELRMSEGRIHKCGTLVEEQEVEIDVRAEYTVSLRNSEILLELLSNSNTKGVLKRFLTSGKAMLEQLQRSEEEYRKRLHQIVSQKCIPYPDQWHPQKDGIDIKKMEPLGLLLTSARRPELYFPDTS